jgi:hypothetical protein
MRRSERDFEFCGGGEREAPELHEREDLFGAFWDVDDIVEGLFVATIIR